MNLFLINIIKVYVTLNNFVCNILYMNVNFIYIDDEIIFVQFSLTFIWY